MRIELHSVSGTIWPGKFLLTWTLSRLRAMLASRDWMHINMRLSSSLRVLSISIERICCCGVQASNVMQKLEAAARMDRVQWGARHKYSERCTPSQGHVSLIATAKLSFAAAAIGRTRQHFGPRSSTYITTVTAVTSRYSTPVQTGSCELCDNVIWFRPHRRYVLTRLWTLPVPFRIWKQAARDRVLTQLLCCRHLALLSFLAGGPCLLRRQHIYRERLRKGKVSPGPRGLLRMFTSQKRGARCALEGT